MSYILDALRRADSERERGAVPSIHSPPVPPVADDPQPSPGQPQRLLVGVIVLLLLALVSLLAWHWMGDQGARPQSAAAPNAVVAEAPPQTPPPQPVQAPTEALPRAPMSMAPPAPTAAERSSPAPTVATPPATAAPVITTPAPPPPARQAPSPTATPPSPAPMTAPPVVTVPARPAVTTLPSSVAAPAPPAAPQADARVYAVHDLPADIQRDLPKLVVGGAMYSDSPAKRMLIINSQVFHEGDKLGPDLLLQEIKLKSAVFQYKGYRYGVSY